MWPKSGVQIFSTIQSFNRCPSLAMSQGKQASGSNRSTIQEQADRSPLSLHASAVATMIPPHQNPASDMARKVMPASLDTFLPVGVVPGGVTTERKNHKIHSAMSCRGCCPQPQYSTLKEQPVLRRVQKARG